jgi:acyl carrier protein
MDEEVKPGLMQLEDKLAEIWSRELQGQIPQYEDDFFALGGESFNMVNMMFSVEREFGIELAPNALFEHATLGQFAEMLKRTLTIELDERAAANASPRKLGTI